MTKDVKFELPDPALEQYTWVLWDEHGPSSRPPLLLGEGPFPGNDPSPLPRSIIVNGFMYMRDGGGFGFGNPFGMPEAPPRSVEDMRRWRQVWLPEVEKVVVQLESFDPASVPPGAWQRTLAAQSADQMRVFAGVHRTTIFPGHQALQRFRQAFLARFGQERLDDLEALLMGAPNASVDRAVKLWELSRVLRAAPALLDALDRGTDLPEGPRADAFREGFAGLMAEYGATTNADLEDLPTWREDRSIPMAIIRAYARQPDESGPRAAARRQRERRLQIEAELRELARTDASVAALVPLMEMAQEFVPNLEDHNYHSDQRISAASRARWLAIGRHLRAKGMLAAPDDVFYLQREELVPALEGQREPSKAVLAERRRVLAEARATMPPPFLGRPLAALPEKPSAPRATETRVLRGYGASPGSYRGRARLIETLQEAGGLEQGEIMVCRTTSPPWTPFFGVIGALVTNSGGALSHGAVVAREFGIPAVVGTMLATLQIPDGATVTVDGTNGLVIIEG